MISMVLVLYAAIPAQAKNLAWGLVFTELGIFLFLPLAFAAYLKLDFRETFRLRAPSPRYILAAILMFIGGEFCAATLVAVQNAIFPLPQQLLDAMEKLLRATQNQPLWIILLVSAVLPAVCEEISFRGIVLSGFLTRLRPAAALALTGVVFAVFHLSLYRFVPIFLLGWAIAYLTWKSGSIFTGMILHLLNNAGAGVLLNYPELDRFGLLQMDASFRNLGIGLVIVALALYVSGFRPRIRRDTAKE
jgi:sodium transport system permease protein